MSNILSWKSIWQVCYPVTSSQCCNKDTFPTVLGQTCWSRTDHRQKQWRDQKVTTLMKCDIERIEFDCHHSSHRTNSLRIPSMCRIDTADTANWNGADWEASPSPRKHTLPRPSKPKPQRPTLNPFAPSFLRAMLLSPPSISTRTTRLLRNPNEVMRQTVS